MSVTLSGGAIDAGTVAKKRVYNGYGTFTASIPTKHKKRKKTAKKPIHKSIQYAGPIPDVKLIHKGVTVWTSKRHHYDIFDFVNNTIIIKKDNAHTLQFKYPRCFEKGQLFWGNPIDLQRNKKLQIVTKCSNKIETTKFYPAHNQLRNKEVPAVHRIKVSKKEIKPNIKVFIEEFGNGTIMQFADNKITVKFESYKGKPTTLIFNYALIEDYIFKR